MLNFFKFQRSPPDLQPDEAELRSWAAAEWVEYQAWLFHHSFVSLHDWQALRAAAQLKPVPRTPRFSILTPVFNTPASYLYECLYSVRTQSYPFWELCVVDDGSQCSDTLEVLHAAAQQDSRIRVETHEHNTGICTATNRALGMARGEYVAFLDHDDRLAPDALSRVAAVLDADSCIDIVYSDRDMLSLQNLRFMHLFKPDWSPETLLSGNYLFHLLVYRRALLTQLGGVRPEYEGSQDYDLILRAAETDPVVRHIPRVLYHWRQHEASVSLAHNSKDYAYEAGLRALGDHLTRRKLSAKVTENPYLWRGNYRVTLTPPAPETYHVTRIENPSDYMAIREQALCEDWHYLVLLGTDVEALDVSSLAELVSWLQIPQVGMVTGKVLDWTGNLLHAGLVLRPDGEILELYRGHPETTPGYMAVTASTRNVRIPHPSCCALDVGALRQLKTSPAPSLGGYALFDDALQLAVHNLRCVYTPWARFRARTWPDNAWQERAQFVSIWTAQLAAGDPYYNPHLTLELNDMGLEARGMRLR